MTLSTGRKKHLLRMGSYFGPKPDPIPRVRFRSFRRLWWKVYVWEIGKEKGHYQAGRGFWKLQGYVLKENRRG